MLIPSKYWTIQIIDAPIFDKNQLTGGYKTKIIHEAQEFFKRHFLELVSQPRLSPQQNRHIQTVLWEIFHFAVDIRQRAIAGLCLRCYVSETILIACKKISHTYKSGIQEGLFTYIDLLPFVLNDDGKTLIILDSKEQVQQILFSDGKTRPIAKECEFFSVEILQKFKPNLRTSESLDNWTWRLTKQNQKLKLFLWEFGIFTPSDWGLLCRDIPRSIDVRLAKGDRKIIEVFHAVYRRDRRKSNEKGLCSEPTVKQLQEMMLLLQQQNTSLISARELIHHLQRIAEILRQDMLYKKTGRLKTIPTEVYDKSLNEYTPNRELPYHTDPDLEEIELSQLESLCNTLFENVLYQATAEVIGQHIEYLKKSKGYQTFAPQFNQGLLLYYQENMSLGDIAKLWEVPWCTVRRVFKLENLIEKIQYRTEEKFLEQILKLSSTSKSITKLKTISTDPDYLKNVASEIRNYILNKTFQKARAEIQSGQKKSKSSVFAQILCRYIKESLNHAA